MKELITSLVDSSKERIKSPIAGTFLISFVLINWRPLAVFIASSQSMEDRICYIDINYVDWSALGWPLTVTTIYLLLVPYIHVGVDRLTIRAKNDRVGLLRQEKISLLKHKKQEAVLEREIASERAGTNEIERLKEEADRSQKILELTREELNKSKEALQIQESKLINRETQINGLKSDMDNLKTSKGYEGIILSFLTSSDPSSDFEIKKFLRDEFSSPMKYSLKRFIANKSGINSPVPFDSTLVGNNEYFLSLMLKSDMLHFRKETQEYFLSAEGLKFIENLE